MQAARRAAGIAAALVILALAGVTPMNAVIARPTASVGTGATDAASTVLDQLHAAASRADGAAYFALFAPDAVFIGTDATERWPIAAFRDYAMARFATGHGWTYTPRERHVTLAPIPCGCVAWFDEVLDSANYGTSRGTGVLIKTEHGWKIAQYALTFPVPNDLAADITGRIKAFEAGQHR
jgi:hypothetical protein